MTLGKLEDEGEAEVMVLMLVFPLTAFSFIL